MLTTIQQDIALGQAINLVHAEGLAVQRIVTEDPDSQERFKARVRILNKLILDLKKEVQE